MWHLVETIKDRISRKTIMKGQWMNLNEGKQKEFKIVPIKFNRYDIKGVHWLKAMLNNTLLKWSLFSFISICTLYGSFYSAPFQTEQRESYLRGHAGLQHRDESILPSILHSYSENHKNIFRRIITIFISLQFYIIQPNAL